MEELQEKRRRRLPGWAKVVLAVCLTLALSTAGWCLLLGSSGVAMVQGWLLARFAFVDTTADLGAAADQALSGLVSGLGDRWSYYLSEEDYQRVTANRANNYVGVGVTVSYEREEGLLVQSVTEGGPADQAGVLPGDVIVAVDGQSIAGDERENGSALIRGEAGTQVVLTLLREEETLDVTCTRATLRSPSASGKLLEGSIGYVYLANFYSGAADSFREQVDALVAQGAESLIIDLRNDPGGYVAELKQILDYLLPEGPVFTEKPRWWFSSVYQSDAACIDLPMVALVNADTYSAAELLAAQLRESVGAPIVGALTSGKGYSQITFPLANGGGLGISTATYCTGSGHSLIGEGITPDVELDDADEQLQAAIDLLK
jgi:carboxyl-terminal processing protease